MTPHYKIGEISAMLNITPETLRFYEKKGLVTPDKSPENGYRTYALPDIYRLLDIIFYRRLDIGLEDIRQLLTHDDLPAIQQLLAEKKSTVEQKIQQLHLTLKKLEATERSWQQIPHLLNQYVLESFPPAYQIAEQATACDSILPDISLFSQEHFELGMLLQPLTLVEGSWIEGSHWQIVLDCQLADELGLTEQLKDLPRLSYDQCFRTIVRMEDGGSFHPSVQRLYEHLTAHGYRLKDTISYDYLCSAIENDQMVYYYNLYAPVQL